jgi:hypothetical protein
MEPRGPHAHGLLGVGCLPTAPRAGGPHPLPPPPHVEEGANEDALSCVLAAPAAQRPPYAPAPSWERGAGG